MRIPILLIFLFIKPDHKIEHLKGIINYTRTEFLIKYDKDGKPIDTSINDITSFNSLNNPIEETRFFNGSIINKTIYMYNNTIVSPYLKKKDSIVYILLSQNGMQEFHYYNGLLVEKKIYDKYKNIIKDVSFGIDLITNKDSVIIKYIYSYKNKRIICESRVAQGALWYRLQNSYNHKGNLVEKQYLIYDCCAIQQPIPPDRIVYRYDLHNNLIEKISIIDRNIKRKYKDKNDGYFNQVIITSYQYDKYNRLTEKKEYEENYSDDPKLPLDSLYKPSIPLEAYIYKYNRE